MSVRFSHIPVLLEETIDSLDIKSNGVYVDATAGGGGHSSEMLKRLGPDGRLICIDQDPTAIKVLEERFGDDGRVTVVHSNFSNIKQVLSDLDTGSVDGILADLGVSSHQLDTAERGFSFHSEAPLDMRMSQEGRTAADLCNTLPESELRRILYEYGEERFAPAIASAICKAREEKPIETTLELSELVKESVPAKAKRVKHPARKTFQALRIAVNGEMDVLDSSLDSMFDSLKPGGRLSIITFHSLEDRMVKTRFAEYCKGCVCPPEFPVCVCGRTPSARLPFKFRAAGEKELENNKRSRSARLRCVEKIKERNTD